MASVRVYITAATLSEVGGSVPCAVFGCNGRDAKIRLCDWRDAMGLGQHLFKTGALYFEYDDGKPDATKQTHGNPTGAYSEGLPAVNPPEPIPDLMGDIAADDDDAVEDWRKGGE